MSQERPSVSASEIRSFSSKTIEGYRLSGFGCSLCDWKTKTKELFEALPLFGVHNSQAHPNTFAAKIEYIYKK